MGKYHIFSHHNHQLELKDYHKRYTCDGCKEPGFGPTYRCEQCDFDLHKDCMFAHSFSPTHHEFFEESSFEFLQEPPKHRGDRFCDACGKQIRGYVYHCKERGWDLHPYCHKLPMKLHIQEVKLRLRDKIVSDCIWCNRKYVKGSVSNIRGWSYESECGDYHFHVHCAKEMIVKGWKNGAYIKDNGENIDNKDENNNNKLMVLKNLKLPIQARSNRGRRDNKYLDIVKLFFKTIISILLGDPTAIIAHVVVELITR